MQSLTPKTDITNYVQDCEATVGDSRKLILERRGRGWFKSDSISILHINMSDQLVQDPKEFSFLIFFQGG